MNQLREDIAVYALKEENGPVVDEFREEFINEKQPNEEWEDDLKTQDFYS